jgi:hypothetical protein
MQHDALTPGQEIANKAFVVTWVIMAVFSFAFFQFNRNAALKKRVFPIAVGVTSVLFMAFIAWMTKLQSPLVFVMLGAVVLIAVINIRTTKFCESCGRTLIKQPLFSKTKYCPKCGAEMK